jgi:hypothetical protein
MYMLIKLDLYEYTYWATGQSTVDAKGYNINMTDPYPTIWKIDIKKNVPVLLSYIENIFFYSSGNKFEGKSAGQIYSENKDAYSLYDSFNQLNRWLHPFQMNKSYLWFPGIRWNNVCDQVKLPDDIVFYQPNIDYNLVKDKSSGSLSLSKWENIDNAVKKIDNMTSKFDGRVTATIVVTVLLLLIAFGIYVYLMYFRR